MEVASTSPLRHRLSLVTKTHVPAVFPSPSGAQDAGRFKIRGSSLVGVDGAGCCDSAAPSGASSCRGISCDCPAVHPLRIPLPCPGLPFPSPRCGNDSVPPSLPSRRPCRSSYRCRACPSSSAAALFSSFRPSQRRHRPACPSWRAASSCRCGWSSRSTRVPMGWRWCPPGRSFASLVRL